MFSRRSSELRHLLGAAGLRLFVITRDPLDWIAERGHAWTTDTSELVASGTLEAVRHASAEGTDLATAVGRFGREPVGLGAIQDLV